MSQTLIDDRPAPEPDDGEPDLTVDPDLEGSAPTDAPRRWPVRAFDRFIHMPVEGWISLFIVGFCVGFVFYQMGPSNILANNTPAGGDMGAHVWGPAYLRDHLLPSGRLTGWTPDWYAGFPAYTFYMIIPSLAIALLSYVIPYGIAFKLVAISGVLTLPIAAWAYGRLTRLPFPASPLLAVGATAFLFDRSFSIYGGNIASTLAGEFAFSISLTFAVLYLGVLSRSFESGKYRAAAAILLALTGLCHLIPLFFALAGTAVWFALQLDWGRVKFWMWGVIAALSVGGGAWFSDSLLPEGQLSWKIYAPAFICFVILMVITAVVLGVLELFRTRSPWRVAVPVLAVGGLLTSFWIVPFYLRGAYVNDMGWEKKTNYANYLFSRASLDPQLSDRPGLGFLLILAAMGGLLALVYRRRGGLFWLIMAVLAGVAFLYVPQGRLWNARLLPFYYLSIYLLGAIGVAELGRTVARIVSPNVRRPTRAVLWGTTVAGWAVWMIVLGLPLHTLPGETLAANGKTWTWGPLTTKDSSFIPSWAAWNFTGYEGKAAYPEYYQTVQTMAQLGQDPDHGCGRAMWEQEPQHDRYGTPMAMMLLPFWTDGCIGSMEGLYFEASATTPYHFLNQDELSTSPSNAQRDLPYGPGAPNRDEFNLGIQHLQMLGVKYYMAISSGMIDLARSNNDLSEVASSGPWVVFQVADSELVTPLQNEPAVVNGASAGGKTWLNDTVNWYMDNSDFDVPLAADGPSSWQRINSGDTPEKRPVGTTEVSNIKSGTDTMSFDVTETGVPVLVKASYFPNWQVSGAEGPYRVSPNLMVVIPTSNHVSMHYGFTSVDYLSWILTILGIAGVVWLLRAKPVSIPETPAIWREADEWDDGSEPDPSDPAWWNDLDGTGAPPDGYEGDDPLLVKQAALARFGAPAPGAGPPTAPVDGPPIAGEGPGQVTIDPADAILGPVADLGNDTSGPPTAPDPTPPDPTPPDRTPESDS